MYYANCYFPNNKLPENITFNPNVESNGNGFRTQIQNETNAFTITVSANSGYYFPRKPTLTLTDLSGFEVSFTENLNADSTIYEFTFNPGESTFETIQRITYTSIEVVQKIPTPTGLGNFLTYYKVNDEILNQLSKVIYIEQTSSTGEIRILDLSEYITSLRLYPFEIESSDSVDVILANRNTGVKAPIANEILHEIDLGNVTIASTNNNTNDFDNTTLRINLPYIGLQSLQSVRYIGNTVNLRYNVDLITGLCTANLYVDDKMLDCFSGKIGLDMPYRVAAKDILSGVIDTTINRLYPINATITIEYHENYNADNTIIIDDNKYGTISDFQKQNYDFVKIDNITNFPMFGIPFDISKMIIDQLRQGIYLA